MRQRQRFALARHVRDNQQVDIDLSRPPALALRTPQRPLYALDDVQQGQRRQAGLDDRAEVQELALVSLAPWLCPVDRRDRNQRAFRPDKV